MDIDAAFGQFRFYKRTENLGVKAGFPRLDYIGCNGIDEMWYLNRPIFQGIRRTE